MSYTKEDIIRIVKEEDIEFIRMQFVDIFGQLKNVAITASQIEKAVNNQITFDGSSIPAVCGRCDREVPLCFVYGEESGSPIT